MNNDPIEDPTFAAAEQQHWTAMDALRARAYAAEAVVERLQEERDALTRCIKHMTGEDTDVESLIRTHVRALRREAASGEQA